MKIFVFPGQGDSLELEDILTFAGEEFFEELFPNEKLRQALTSGEIAPDYFQFFSFIHQIAAVKALAGRGVEPDVVAGFSFGEFASYCTAGILSFEECVRLVLSRNQIANQLGCKDAQMMAVVGLSIGEIEAFVEKFTLDIEITNYNTSKQFVIAGKNAELARFQELSGAAVAMLNLPVAYHSRTMAAAQEAFAEEIRQCKFCQPQKMILSSVSGRLIDDADEAKELLLVQMTSPLRWSEACATIGILAPERIFFPGDGRKVRNICRKNRVAGELIKCGRLAECATASEVADD
ncbi:MAG: ACP S-malonyltransferase [Spirochaetales bacterium]|nr:ACP S-malonyltransferase [Spirochaetales bacterium]